MRVITSSLVCLVLTACGAQVDVDPGDGGFRLSVPFDVWGARLDACALDPGDACDADLDFLSVHASTKKLELLFLWAPVDFPSALRLLCSCSPHADTDADRLPYLVIEMARTSNAVARPARSRSEYRLLPDPTGGLVLLPPFVRGDSCGDSTPDMVAVLVMMWSPPPRDYFTEGDTDADGDVDVLDALALLYTELYSLPWGIPGPSGSSPPGPPGTNSATSLSPPSY